MRFFDSAFGALANSVFPIVVCFFGSFFQTKKERLASLSKEVGLA